MSLPAQLGLIYLVSELLLTATRHSRRSSGEQQDESTLRVLWMVIGLSVLAGLAVALHFRATAFPRTTLVMGASIITFAAGLLFRWWAIIQLGRFFTVDVTIARDHELVESGPFRFVRHPSYTGVLLAFIGFALSLGNWLALLVIFFPIFAAFVRRMNVEERALRGALGESYAAYMRRTKRLVPFVY